MNIKEDLGKIETREIHSSYSNTLYSFKNKLFNPLGTIYKNNISKIIENN